MLNVELHLALRDAMDPQVQVPSSHQPVSTPAAGDAAASSSSIDHSAAPVGLANGSEHDGGADQALEEVDGGGAGDAPAMAAVPGLRHLNLDSHKEDAQVSGKVAAPGTAQGDGVAGVCSTVSVTE